MPLVTEDPVVIVSAARTPLGAFQGDFASLSASDLGAVAIKAVVERAGIDAACIDSVILGNCLMAGQGQAPARQAALKAGLPESVGAITLSRMCGSGMQAVMCAQDSLLSGNAEVVIAGGMESMTNAPYLLPKARAGYRMGHGNVLDHMMVDGLEDAYTRKDATQGGLSMGLLAEACATKYEMTRQAQDDFAIASIQRAQTAAAQGLFDWELAPVTVTTRAGTQLITQDESPKKANIEKIAQLRPAFHKEGTITAANASSINDGAAALLLMRASRAQKMGLQPIAKLLAQASYSQAPAWFTTAPVGAIRRVFEKTGWRAEDVDLYEINEAFAVVTLAAMQAHNLPHARVNIHGGACALGHPIGASGARIIVTLLGALQATGGQKGLASLCIGGGEGVALALSAV